MKASFIILFLTVASQPIGCFLIGGAIGAAADGPPTYDTIAVSQLEDIEEGTTIELTMKDQSHIEALYIRTDTSSSGVPLIVLAPEAQNPFGVPIDSVKDASLKDEPKTGKIIGRLVGLAVDVTFFIGIANWSKRGF